ncbi:HNH/endonuclease VII fold putative polymorphic toxin, partial [Pseudomonas salomonii]|uniref:HNH/endonuclease VII fold putative polymorphic toxin n=1 Tax=Pseudomonas salomonii TaxID=191391 RepID=UPI0011C4806C
EGRVYIFELQERQIEIREHSLGHKKGNLGPHFNTEASIDGKSTPLKNHVDNHSYFKGKK